MQELAIQHSKDLVDEEDPFFDGSFLHSFNLSFPHHVRLHIPLSFVELVNDPNPIPSDNRFIPRWSSTMLLEILFLLNFTLEQLFFLFRFVYCFRIKLYFLSTVITRGRKYEALSTSYGKKAFGGNSIAFGCWEKVQRIPGG